MGLMLRKQESKIHFSFIIHNKDLILKSVLGDTHIRDKSQENAISN